MTDDHDQHTAYSALSTARHPLLPFPSLLTPTATNTHLNHDILCNGRGLFQTAVRCEAGRGPVAGAAVQRPQSAIPAHRDRGDGAQGASAASRSGRRGGLPAGGGVRQKVVAPEVRRWGHCCSAAYPFQRRLLKIGNDACRKQVLKITEEADCKKQGGYWLPAGSEWVDDECHQPVGSNVDR